MIDYCTDIGFVSLNKHGEYLCGDHVECSDAESSRIIVLADGLGSGVKASILSTLTSKILSTMIANSMPMEECISTIAATLPTCSDRGVAYSTFTAIRIIDNQEAEIIQYDNPEVIILRDGRNFEYPVISQTIEGKKILKTRIKLEEGDTLVALSDGVVYAGLGITLNYGWQRKDIIEYLEESYDKGSSAKTICAQLAGRCEDLYAGMPGDDTTVCVARLRRRRQVNLLIGPPQNPEDLPKMMSLFFSKEGAHIVCGGTTSSLAAGYLKAPLEAGFSSRGDPEIPPISKIRGVDLVTEGVITMSRVLEYAVDYQNTNLRFSEWRSRDDGASLVSRFLFEEATDINFFVGRASNPAHQNSGLQIGFNSKMKLIEELAACLDKMGKTIKVSYF